MIVPQSFEQRDLKRLLIVDGNHLASRCRHAAVGSLATSAGQPTGVIYGVLRGIGYVLSRLKLTPEQCCVVWDGGLCEERLRQFPDYKISRRTRVYTPEEKAESERYYWQLDQLRALLPLVGLRQVMVRGAEADDLISLIAHAHAGPVVIDSGDRDFHTLLNGRIRVWDYKRDLIDDEYLLEKWGTTDGDEILLLRAIIGDNSDDIPGVPTVGEKRAQHAVLGQRNGKLAQAAKWSAVVAQHQDIVERNLRIMRLPRCYEEAWYSGVQIYEMLRQLSAVPTRDRKLMASRCRELEMDSLLEELSW